MEPIVALRRYDHEQWYRPGAVGQIGDTNLTVRLKHSAPDLPIRWDKEFSGRRLINHGSNVSDGQHTGFVNHGGVARLIDSNWDGVKKKHIGHGWNYQDLQPEDKMITPEQASLPQFDWQKRLGLYEELKTNTAAFAPLPGGFGTTGVPRGGNFPTIVGYFEPDSINPYVRPFGHALHTYAPESYAINLNRIANDRNGQEVDRVHNAVYHPDEYNPDVVESTTMGPRRINHRDVFQ